MLQLTVEASSVENCTRSQSCKAKPIYMYFYFLGPYDFSGRFVIAK